MSTRWTTEQEKAITIRNCNTLVSAAAGSGKTAVLVQRVIDMITDETNPVYINKLLIATFTNAAASEMKDRIYRALQQKIKDNPNNSFLREQLVLLGQAQISTIHSFCMNLIRENFHLLGIRHDFDIADDVKLSTIKKSAMEEVLEKNYIEGNKDFLDTVDAFGGKKNDDNLSEIIVSVYNFAESLPEPSEWLECCVKNPENSDFIQKFKDITIKSINQTLSCIVHEYERALDAIENDADLGSYYDIYLNEYNMFSEMLDDKSDTVKNKASVFSFERLPRKGKNADPVSVDFVKKVRDNAKKQFVKICDLYLYTDEEISDEIMQMHPFVKTVCNLVGEFKRIYSSMKLGENLLDFNDLEHFAIKLLKENDDVRDYMKGYYKEILVDEYQDTNGVQAYLFELLSNGSNLFMVGDVKQSIYGFRNSNPKYFIEKYNSFDCEYAQSGTKINLAKNFRSSNAVINTVNGYFEKLMIADLGGVSYNDDHALVYGNMQIKDIECPVERYIINTRKSDNDEEDIGTDKVMAEAIFTANRIHELVEVQKPEIYDKNTDSYRPVTYRDIVILMRKTKNVASVYADVFAERGIPVYTAESGGYFNCTEIATVMSFLKVIENPLQDIPMLAVMRSPIYGFDDNLIAQLRSENKKIHIFTLLKKSENEKVKSFIKEIDKFREYARYNNVAAVVRKIIFDTGYYQFAGGLSNGEIRMMNLNLLCERANTFSHKEFKDISKFISYINTMVESGNEYSSPKLISENDNVVNIMSIHKSKGLEFPIVFLCESGLAFNKMDLSKPFVFDEELGLSMNIVDMKRRLKYVPYVKKAMCEKKTDELIAEEIRLLYVALTRAKFKVIISGTMAFSGEILSESEANAYNIKLKKNYLDMLLADIKGIPDAKVFSISHILNADVQCVSRNGEQKRKSDYSEFYNEISERLEFSYSYPHSKYIPSKKSISEVVSLEDSEINLASVNFTNSEITSAQRGTLIHFVLQNIDLNNVESRDAVAFQIDEMINMGIFEEKFKGIIDIDAIYGFFISDIGKRMLNSKRVYREFKFCVDIPANELDYSADGETVLMQGVIDCCFIEDNSFVIIDYKTGSLKEKYKRQVELYKRCLEISTGKSVKETYIYPLI